MWKIGEENCPNSNLKVKVSTTDVDGRRRRATSADNRSFFFDLTTAARSLTAWLLQDAQDGRDAIDLRGVVESVQCAAQEIFRA
jgi:hypothetical protein